jgi:hypothetical protein
MLVTIAVLAGAAGAVSLNVARVVLGLVCMRRCRAGGAHPDDLQKVLKALFGERPVLIRIRLGERRVGSEDDGADIPKALRGAGTSTRSLV